MYDCLFCKIVAGEIPSHKVYEDDMIVAMLDIAHFTKGHTLILPKSHYSDFLDTPDEILAKIAVVAKDLSLNYKPILGADGFNSVTNAGDVAGQEVMHYHVHLIPRYQGNDFDLKAINKTKDVDLEKLANDLRGE